MTTTTVTEPEEPQLLNSLHAQIQALVDVRTRLQTIRHIPLRLLRLPPPSLLDTIHDTSSLTPSASASFKTQELKGFAELVKSGPVQAALATAKDSIKAKGAVVGRRERGKRKYGFVDPSRFPPELMWSMIGDHLPQCLPSRTFLFKRLRCHHSRQPLQNKCTFVSTTFLII
jgi:hypothetical protein